MAVPTINTCQILTNYNSSLARIGQFFCTLASTDQTGVMYLNSLLFFENRSGYDNSLPPKISSGGNNNPYFLDFTQNAVGLFPGTTNIFTCYNASSGTPNVATQNLTVRGILLYLDRLPTQGAMVPGNIVLDFDYYIEAGQSIKLTAHFSDTTTADSPTLVGGTAGSAQITIPMSAAQSRTLTNFSVHNVTTPADDTNLFMITLQSDNTRKVQKTNEWIFPKPITFTQSTPAATTAGYGITLHMETIPMDRQVVAPPVRIAVEPNINPGDTVRLSLTFRRGDPITVDYTSASTGLQWVEVPLRRGESLTLLSLSIMKVGSPADTTHHLYLTDRTGYIKAISTLTYSLPLPATFSGA